MDTALCQVTWFGEQSASGISAPTNPLSQVPLNVGQPFKEWWIESKEGEIISIRSLTSIPVLQNLAAHRIFGCLRTAEILPIDPEARVVFLYQVTVVPDYCNRQKREKESTSDILKKSPFACFPL